MTQPLRNDRALVGFLVTNFRGHYPDGTTAIVYASDREHCKAVLAAELRARRLAYTDLDRLTIDPITPPPAAPAARVILQGEYRRNNERTSR